MEHGKLSQEKQYLNPPRFIFSQVLIRHWTRVFGLPLSSPRQPGQGFCGLLYAMQSRQFIPHGAIKVHRIGSVRFDLRGIISLRMGRSVPEKIDFGDIVVLWGITREFLGLSHQFRDKYLCLIGLVTSQEAGKHPLPCNIRIDQRVFPVSY